MRVIESIKNTVSDTVSGLRSGVTMTQLIIIGAALALLVLVIVLIVVWRRRRAAARRSETPSFFESEPTDTFAALGYIEQRPAGALAKPDDDYVHAPDVPARQVEPAPSVVRTPAPEAQAPAAPAAAPVNAGFNWDETPVVPMSSPVPASTGATPAAGVQPAAASAGTAAAAIQPGPASQGPAQATQWWPTPAPSSAAPSQPPPASSAPRAQWPAPSAAAPRPAAPVRPPALATGKPSPVEVWARKLVPLNELVRTPSTELVDLSDPEVRHMLTGFVSLKIERAMELRNSGQIAEALAKLAQAEKITRALGIEGATQHVHDMIAELNRPPGPRA